jgi:hypothetical protein
VPDPIISSDSAATNQLELALQRDLAMSYQQFTQAGETAWQASRLRQQLGTGFKAEDVMVSNQNEITVLVDSPAEASLVTSFDALPIPRQAPFDSPFQAPLHRLARVVGPPAGSPVASISGTACTLAFWGYQRSGKPVALTSGHCNSDAGSAVSEFVGAKPFSEAGRLASKAFGSYTTTAFGDGYDVAVIEAAPGVAANSLIHRWSSRRDLAVTGQVEPVVGAPVCKSGAATGWTCGVITSATRNYTLQEAGSPSVYAFSTSLCSASGDSGAPVVTGSLAVGILSAGSFDIRSGDSAAACKMATQVTRFREDALAYWPQVNWSGLEKMLNTQPGNLIMSAVFPLVSDGPSVNRLLGDDWQLAVHVKPPQVVKASAGRTKTVIKGRVKLRDHRPSDWRVAIRLQGKTKVVQVDSSGAFAVKFAKISKTTSYTMTVQHKSDRHLRSSKLKGTVKPTTR